MVHNLAVPIRVQSINTDFWGAWNIVAHLLQNVYVIIITYNLKIPVGNMSNDNMMFSRPCQPPQEEKLLVR